VVVRAGALADAAEVDAQGLEARVVQGARAVEHHGVVHRAAVERVGMEDQRDARGVVACRPVDRLEPTVPGRDQDLAGEHAVSLHHGASCQ
jgi:hypothetical protein